MKLKSSLLAGAIVAFGASLSLWAQKDPSPTPLGQDKTLPDKAAFANDAKDPSPTPLGRDKALNDFTQIQIKNFQDESLGRIKDLGIDLVNGRIVEVLVVSDSSLDVGNKIVAVPPRALVPDLLNEVYRLNVSPEVFKSAAAINLKEWSDWGRSDRIAAAYRLFNQLPYFMEEGDTASPTAARPKVLLGYVERTVNILDMPVGNFQNEKFGKVWSMTLDIPNGRILNVIVMAPGNYKTKSIVPAMALSFNAKRDALLIDDTKREFADEPRYVLTEAAFGQDAYYNREALKGARTNVALEQGNSYRDVDRTVRIHRDIRAAKVNGRNVEIGTINDRVTLRGWVYTSEDKRRIGEIAIAASTMKENVDNQILVGKPVTNN